MMKLNGFSVGSDEVLLFGLSLGLRQNGMAVHLDDLSSDGDAQLLGFDQMSAGNVRGHDGRVIRRRSRTARIFLQVHAR